MDIGTSFLVSAKQDANNQLKIKSIRNAFFEIDNDSAIKNMLTMSNVDFIEDGDRIFILGQNANVIASVFKREVSRPMACGVISAGESASERLMLVLLESVLGKATVPGEPCYFSVPGDPIDRELDIIYHTAVLKKLIGPSHLGYDPYPLNEAAAVIFANAAPEQFSALGLSFGAGMINICLMYKTMIGLSYSIINSGDWVDSSVARTLGTSSVRIQMIKEKNEIDLLKPSEGDPKIYKEREAISIYYRSLILRVFESLKTEFVKNKKADFALPESIPIIISGGTALAKNFLELFKSSFETIKDWPIPISEIRMAKDPLGDVARGLLVVSLNKKDRN